MSARAHVSTAPRGAHPLTVAGACLLAASELRVIADLLARGMALPRHAPALLEKHARCFTAAADALRDPITHHPCCAEAERLAQEAAHLRRRSAGLLSLLDDLAR
jgi:hypothetical protein